MKEYTSKHFDYRAETKKFLIAYREQQLHVKHLERDIQDKYETATKMIPTYSEQPIGHSSVERLHPGAELAEDDELRIMREKLKEARRFVDQIDELLSVLTPAELAVVKLKYFDRKPWQEVDEAIGYSEEQRRRIHRFALRQIAIGLFGASIVSAADRKIV